MWECLDALPECAWTATASGELDFLNAQWLTYTGTAPGEDVGYAWARHLHPEDVAAALEAWSTALSRTAPVRRIARVRGVDGEYRWFLVRARPVLNSAGLVVRWIGLNTDIHDRHIAEQYVARERHLLHAVLEQIPVDVAVAEAPSDKGIVSNRRTAQVWGCPNGTLPTYERVEQCNSTPLKMWHGSGHPCALEDWPMAQSIQHGRTIMDGMAALERMDGTCGTLRVNAAPVRDSHGVVIAGVVVVEDMQARIAAEEELVRLRADEATARKAAESKQLLLANVSHDMRTPLNAIIGMASSLLSGAALERSAALTAEQVQCITDMRESGRLLSTLVNDILTFSQLEVGKLALVLAPFSAEPLLRSAANMMSVMAAEKKLSVTTTIGADIPAALVGDEMRLRQVLANLLSNAIKFTPAGGHVSVRVGLKPPPCVAALGLEPSPPATTDAPAAVAEVSTPPAHNPESSGPTPPPHLHHIYRPDAQVLPPSELELWFSVEDTGIGVPMEAVPRLFQPFSQADATTARKYGGAGLGLSICKRLVEAMGGSIGVAPRIAGGALFWFNIRVQMTSELVRVDARVAPDLCCGAVPPPSACSWPQTSDNHVPLPEAEIGLASSHATMVVDEVPRPLAGVRVLVAEDDIVNERVVRRMLARLGASVTVVSDGAAAVQAVTTADPMFHAVLMDCAMPLCDGYEATRMIRALPTESRRNVPIIALTAGALPEDLRCSRAAGRVFLIGKLPP